VSVEIRIRKLEYNLSKQIAYEQKVRSVVFCGFVGTVVVFRLCRDRCCLSIILGSG
jgi:hypothetical protein